MAKTAKAGARKRRIAWVAGAGTGIGRALALRLAKDGWTVAISARTAADLESVAAQAAGLRGKILVFPLDVTDEKTAAETVVRIEAEAGPLDLAVLNAGTYVLNSAKEFDVAIFRRTVEVNLMGVVHCLAPVMRTMIGRRSGHIAVTASVSGHVGLPGAAAYGATKAALINMCEALYPELEAEGVRLSVISPGFVDTPLTEGNKFPMPFIITADDAARRIVSGFKSSRFENVFPWRMKRSIDFLAALPYPAFFRVTRRMIRR